MADFYPFGLYRFLRIIWQLKGPIPDDDEREYSAESLLCSKVLAYFGIPRVTRITRTLAVQLNVRYPVDFNPLRRG